MCETIVEIRNLNKSYYGNKVLEDVNLNLIKGNIHGLLGLNGAGKTTLVNVLSGIVKPDSGEIIVEGSPVEFKCPLDAKKTGIATVHQRMPDESHITAAEYLYLNVSVVNPKELKFCTFKKMSEYCQSFFDLLDFDCDPRTRVSSLTIGQKQMLKIAIVLALRPKIIILDEPFGMLTPVETEKLQKMFTHIKNNGIAILMVTHNINEAICYCDEITILKDGKLSAYFDAKKVIKADLLKAMVQNSPIYEYPYILKKSSQVILSVENISTNGILHDVSFNLYKGEILGVAGLLGSGRSSLCKALFGIDRITSGEIKLNGESIKIKSPIHAMKHGIALLPEDIINAGVVQSFTVSENITMANLKAISHHILINSAKQHWIARQYIKQFVIKTPSEKEFIQNLSSGNQQKVNIAKWLFNNSSIFIIDDPTLSVDISSKVEIYNFMNKFVLEGGSILFISSDFEELCGMSDRILVMENGRIIRVLAHHEFTGHNLASILSKSF